MIKKFLSFCENFGCLLLIVIVATPALLNIFYLSRQPGELSLNVSTIHMKEKTFREFPISIRAIIGYTIKNITFLPGDVVVLRDVDVNTPIHVEAKSIANNRTCNLNFSVADIAESGYLGIQHTFDGQPSCTLRGIIKWRANSFDKRSLR